MDTGDFARVVAEFGPASALLVQPGSSAAAPVPAQWARIAEGGDPVARRTATLALWNPDMRELVPRFAAVLDECLDDVRVCLLRGDWVLLYAIRRPYQPHEFRIGWAPESFGAGLPPHWDSLPDGLRVFLRTVHAGFTELDGLSFGPARPRDMRTYHALELERSVRNWDAPEDIPADRATLIAKGLGGTRYFVSPNLPAGTIGWEAGGDMDQPRDFGPTFDELMSHGFQLRRDLPPEPAVPAAPPTPDELRQRAVSAPRAARAIAWRSGLTEEAARARIRELVDALLDALGGQLAARPQDGPAGETLLPVDDDAGTVHQVDRLEARYFLDPPPPDRPNIYLPLIVRFWERSGWQVTSSATAEGIVAEARTSDRYELTLSYRDGTVRLAVASPGFHRAP